MHFCMTYCNCTSSFRKVRQWQHEMQQDSRAALLFNASTLQKEREQLQSTVSVRIHEGRHEDSSSCLESLDQSTVSVTMNPARADNVPAAPPARCNSVVCRPAEHVSEGVAVLPEAAVLTLPLSLWPIPSSLLPSRLPLIHRHTFGLSF